jgi:hypothetical protein
MDSNALKNEGNRLSHGLLVIMDEITKARNPWMADKTFAMSHTKSDSKKNLYARIFWEVR